jgi:hypothetical protein
MHKRIKIELLKESCTKKRTTEREKMRVGEREKEKLL